MGKKNGGTWTVANYQVSEIDSAGNVTNVINANNIGTYQITEATIDDLKLEGIFDLSKDVEINGIHYKEDAVGSIDEEGMRIIMFGGTCIQCDTTYTLDVNSRNKLVWSRYFVGSPWTKTTKVQITLER